MKNKKSLGQVAYEAFHGLLGDWKNNYDHIGWEKVGKVVEREVKRRMKKK